MGDKALLTVAARAYLTNLDYAVLAAYFIGLFLLGIFTSGRQKSEEVYFLGDRRTSWFLAGISVIATLLSTITFLATPGEMIIHGPGYFYSLLAILIIVPAVNRVIIPAMMKLRVTSVYDYLERRFGLSARMTGASVFVATRLVWIGLIIYTASFAVCEMTGWPMWRVVLLMGIVTTFYTTLGGLQAVIWSDFAQFILLFGGALFVPIFVALKTGVGPIGWWNVFHEARPNEAPIFSFDPFVRLTAVTIILNTFLWNLCTHGADQVAAQRYLSTPSAEAAQRSMRVYAICIAVVSALLALCGVSVFYFYYHANMPLAQLAAEGDKLLPRFIATELPSGFSGLMLAALLAAAMSSLSSGINSISTVVVTDFVHRFGTEKKDGATLTLAKFLAATAGLIGICVALVVDAKMNAQAGDPHKWNLIDLIERTNHLFVAPLGALFLVGILSRRVGGAAAVTGFFLGVASGTLVSFGKELVDNSILSDYFQMERPVSFTWIMPVGFAVSLASSYALGYLFKPPSESQLIALYAFGSRLAEAAAEEDSSVRVASSDL